MKRIITSILALTMSVALWAQEDYIILENLGSDEVQHGNEPNYTTKQVLNVWMPDLVPKWDNNVQISPIQADGNGDDSQKWKVVQSPDNPAYFNLIVYSETADDHLRFMDDNPANPYAALSAYQPGNLATIWVRENDNQNWFVTREGEDKHYVMKHVGVEDQRDGVQNVLYSDWEGIYSNVASLPEDGFFWTDEHGIDHPIQLTDDNGVNINPLSQWKYFETDIAGYERIKNFDPLAKYIQGPLDAGIIENGGITTADVSEIISIFNSQLDAGGGDNAITYSWEYSTNGTDYAAASVATNFMDYSGFAYSALGLGDGDILYVRRKATDGTSTEVYSNVITISITDATLALEKSADTITKMYPNPAKSSVTFEAKDFNNIEVFNAIGQSVIKLNGGSNVKLNTSNFEKGIYIVKFSNKSTTIAKRLIIK